MNYLSVPIPYNLAESELTIEVEGTMDEMMEWISNHVAWEDEETMERIFRSTMLLQLKNPKTTLGNCLATALVWERG